MSCQRRQLLAGGALLLVSALLARRVIVGLTSAPPQSGLPAPVTAIDRFYIVSKNLDDPVVDQSSWHLQVTGLVDQPLDLAYDALVAMPSVEVIRTLECISNEVGGDLISTGGWTGLPLPDLLQQAGVQP